jgi:hypothetical protein
VERIWILVGIVLVAALVIVCGLAFIVATRVFPSARAKAGKAPQKMP